MTEFFASKSTASIAIVSNDLFLVKPRKCGIGGYRGKFCSVYCNDPVTSVAEYGGLLLCVTSSVRRGSIERVLRRNASKKRRKWTHEFTVSNVRIVRETIRFFDSRFFSLLHDSESCHESRKQLFFLSRDRGGINSLSFEYFYPIR